MAILAKSESPNPRSRVHKFYNLIKRLHRHHFHVFSFFFTCVGVEMNIIILILFTITSVYTKIVPIGHVFFTTVSDITRWKDCPEVTNYVFS